jgi:pSer/pThr/pTyr-binding forkhead associated (FHA) protein
MKLSLVVQAAGKGEGKVIPIPVSPFLIGRDPHCHLRPASPVISKRHCALTMKGGKAFVSDFNSTNGTFVNSVQVQGEVELHDEDQLKLGPLAFKVRLEVAILVNQATPLPPTKRSGEETDDDMASALLLGLGDETSPSSPGPEVDSQGVPTGSTVMEMLPPQEPGAAAKEGEGAQEKTGPYRPAGAPQPMGNTTEAAKQILDKYLRRTRS